MRYSRLERGWCGLCRGWEDQESLAQEPRDGPNEGGACTNKVELQYSYCKALSPPRSTL